MATVIHPTAIIETGVEIGENVTIGPYTVIESDVQIGDGTSVVPCHDMLGDTNSSKCRIFKVRCWSLYLMIKKFGTKDLYIIHGVTRCYVNFHDHRGTTAVAKPGSAQLLDHDKLSCRA
jgi:UDP-N-acetylglucosamine acyltransferase